MMEGFRKKLYRVAYDKPAVNQKVMQLSRSLDEVKKLLAESSHGKKKNRKLD